jgi:hypothetical protein
MDAEQDPQAQTSASEGATAPEATRIGPNGLAFRPLAAAKHGDNVFSMLAAARVALRSAGARAQVGNDLRERVTRSDTYAEACAIMDEYVEFYT